MLKTRQINCSKTYKQAKISLKLACNIPRSLELHNQQNPKITEEELKSCMYCPIPNPGCCQQ